MPYPAASPAEIASYRERGWLVVEDAIPAGELDRLEAWCDILLAKKEKLAFDWAWDKNEARDQRSFRIVQSSPSLIWKDASEAPYRKWLVDFARDLTGLKLGFWYDQFLGKPPAKACRPIGTRMRGIGGETCATRARHAGYR